MKVLSFLISMMISTSLFAAIPKYELKMDLIFNGKPIPRATIIVNEGEKASVTQKTETSRNFIDVVVTKSAVAEHPGILMKFNIGIIDAQGKRIIKSSPQIISKDTYESKITQGEKGSEEYSISVVATTIN